MARQLARKDSWNSFVGFAPAAPSPTLAFGKFIEIGDVTLALGGFAPSEGAQVQFPKVTLAVHNGAPPPVKRRAAHQIHFGGDSLDETRRNFEGFLQQVRNF